ncbi:MAG: hypothetical protein IJW92_09765 [Clostridia bacterium]|nr:hypothetical protein [Clostridia bacterium]
MKKSLFYRILRTVSILYACHIVALAIAAAYFLSVGNWGWLIIFLIALACIPIVAPVLGVCFFIDAKIQRKKQPFKNNSDQKGEPL